jgi:predicted nucleic acid-binding protein
MDGGNAPRRTRVSAACNSGPLIYLAKLGLLRLLTELHDPVLIPSVVYDEVVTEGVLRGYPDAVVVQRAVVD